MSNTKHLADLLKVCSILPALAIMPAMAEDYTQNGVFKKVENGEILDLSQYDSVLFDDGAKIENYGTVKLGGDVRFENATMNNNNSSVEEQKKIVYSGDGNITFVNGRILNRGAEYSNPPAIVGGLVDFRTTGDISFSGDMDPTGSSAYVNTTILSDMVLQANKITVSGGKSDGYGGAIFNAGDLKILGKENLFTDNHQTAVAAEGKYYKLGGGALYNRGAEGTAEMVVGLSDSSSVNKFISNSAVQNGGAIETRTDDPNSHSVLDVIGKTTFSENTAGVNGGAIMNWIDVSKENATSVINIIGEVNFDNNIAGKNGGAIYNNGTLDLSDAKSTFVINKADESGGAIYNAGKLTIADSDFVENSALEQGGAIYNASGMTIEDSKFSKNSVTTGDGGTIKINVVNGSKTIIKDSDFSENKALGYAAADSGAISISNGDVEISGSDFDKNEAKFGGAMYLYSGNNHHVVVDVTDSEFNENTALSGGAIINIASKKNNEKGGLRLTDVTLSANKATSSESSYGGGALFLGADSQTVITRGVLDGNTSAARGGAIATRVFEEGDNKDALLDIKNTMFKNNIAAANGGAFDNFFYHSATNADAVYVQGSNFVNNSALNGGAIYNHGSTSTQNTDPSVPEQAAAIEINNAQFVGNIASVAGGAIYNEAGATVVLSGNNLFSGNVANKLANDIHNMGTLNITSGTTAFGGGVTGTGTFTLASDATLELGTATINQGKIDLYGTVVASMLNDSVRGGSYGRFIGDVTVGDDASFKLNVGAAGTYNIWNGKIVDAEQVTVGDIYEIAGIDVNGVKIVTKSVANIAETVGISTQAAGAVAGLANANSGKAHQVSLALQDALNAGDVEYIERETKKLNPTEKPVAQAAASSVQNQVLSLTSGRMTGGISVGRAGGDERSQENGFWIQGLFNKSKFADAFHGYTRGVALGADTLIDNKWTIGGGLAFNNTDVHADGGAHTDISSKTLFLYGQYKPNNWFVNATATYSMSEYTENKTVAGVGLGATYDVDAYGAQIMTGYDFTPGITTEAGLRYLHVAQDDYIDGRDAQIMATDTDFLTGIAGLKYAFAIENDWAIQLRPELRAAMTYDFISDDTATTVVMPGVEAYAVNGERLSRMGGEFGIGLTALYKGMEVSLMYDLDLHRDYTSQTGMIKFRGRF